MLGYREHMSCNLTKGSIIKMSLNDRPMSERLHIAFFGLRNAGKSSVVNAVTGQTVSLVSDIKGTTTDPVTKAMELLPLGAVVIIDTPGIDDEGQLGLMRVKRAKEILSKADIAVLVVDAELGIQETDTELIEAFKAHNIPYIEVFNKSDLLSETPKKTEKRIYVSAKSGEGIYELKELIGTLADRAENSKKLIGDLISEDDIIVLVTPIDESAPKGRMILPQVQTIRDVLDHNAINIVTKDTTLNTTLDSLSKKPKMVVTDSQAFGRVSKIVPPEIQLTSFSILFARYKGELREVVRGAAALDKLKDGDTVLISEGCTHHRQCNDIGSVKLPGWILGYTKKDIKFEFTSGNEFPEELSKYSLVIHCGGCMLNEREMKSRIRRSVDAGVPITNYGITIAHIHGILRRSLEPFPEVLAELG